MKRHRPHNDLPSHILILRAVPKHGEGGRNQTENRDQYTPPFDTANDTHHSAARILQRAKFVGVKFGHTYAIENLLAHLTTPAFRKLLRSQRIPLFAFGQINFPSLCHLVHAIRSGVALAQQRFVLEHASSGATP